MSGKSRIHNIAELGSSVLLDINDGDRMTFARLHANSSLKIGSMKCSVEGLIGSPYGAVFEVHKGGLIRVSPSCSGPDAATDEKEDADVTADVRERDNRDLIDTNTAQTLSSDDISRMRKDGVSGQEIIDALVANSSSFVKKTSFSQEKYMRKKQKKYAPRVILRRPSAWSICEAYFTKDPRKIGFCRMDTLALMLSLGNVGANSDVLVLDSLGGLITAAVAERMGGHGSICSTYYTSKRPPIDMVRLLNIDESVAKSVLRAPIATLLAAKNRLHDSSDVAESTKLDALRKGETSAMTEDVFVNSGPSTVPELVATEKTRADVDQSNGADTAMGNTSGLTSDEADQENLCVLSSGALVADTEQPVDLEVFSAFDKDKGKPPRPGMEASSSDIGKWATQGFTSLLVAAPEITPWVIAEQLLPLLSSSSPFVIYHSYQQPLAECMHQLQAKNMAVALQLSEPWSREFQVLPSRTHPHMQMSATGGYLLSGILIVSGNK